ncbi:hypothetical protein [Alphaproteobacteria bacterium endosymbiont of Tiliacea citrago]|uniref:hypothetical protein n=1 Tax=Alphaproteobacteria bacterium endosymbiont of Tiliacea citrago TaxID=3077944 RepID=UPI00313EDA74
MNKKFFVFLLLIIYKSHSPKKKFLKGKDGIGELSKKTNNKDNLTNSCSLIRKGASKKDQLLLFSQCVSLKDDRGLSIQKAVLFACNERMVSLSDVASNELTAPLVADSSLDSNELSVSEADAPLDYVE